MPRRPRYFATVRRATACPRAVSSPASSVSDSGRGSASTSARSAASTGPAAPNSAAKSTVTPSGRRTRLPATARLTVDSCRPSAAATSARVSGSCAAAPPQVRSLPLGRVPGDPGQRAGPLVQLGQELPGPRGTGPDRATLGGGQPAAVAGGQARPVRCEPDHAPGAGDLDLERLGVGRRPPQHDVRWRRWRRVAGFVQRDPRPQPGPQEPPGLAHLGGADAERGGDGGEPAPGEVGEVVADQYGQDRGHPRQLRELQQQAVGQVGGTEPGRPGRAQDGQHPLHPGRGHAELGTDRGRAPAEESLPVQVREQPGGERAVGRAQQRGRLGQQPRGGAGRSGCSPARSARGWPAYRAADRTGGSRRLRTAARTGRRAPAPPVPARDWRPTPVRPGRPARLRGRPVARRGPTAPG